MADETKILLTEAEIPTHWMNLMPDLPGAPAPPLRPDTLQPAGPDDLVADLPDGPDRSRRSRPSRRSRSPTRCARSTSCGARRRSSARAASSAQLDTPAHIYYKYEGTSPAGSHKPNTAVPQAYYNKRGGRRAARDRDRRRPVGIGARVRLPADGHGVRRVHGRLELRPEALPALDDGGRGARRCTAARPTETEAGRAQAVTSDRLARDRDLRGGRGGGRRRRHELRARLGAEPRAAAPDRDRPGGGGADGEGRRVPGRGDRLRRRRVQLRRHRDPVRAGEPARRQADPVRRRASPPPARRSPAASTATTSATRWA